MASELQILTKKNEFVIVTNICDTDNHALYLYWLQPQALYVEIWIIFCRLYYILVTITFFYCKQIKIVV